MVIIGKIIQINLAVSVAKTSRVKLASWPEKEAGKNDKVMLISKPTCKTLKTNTCHQLLAAFLEAMVFNKAERAKTKNKITNTAANDKILIKKKLFKDVPLIKLSANG